MVAQIWLNGRGRESGVEVKGVEAGHLVRFRELKITEFVAFAVGTSPSSSFTRGGAIRGTKAARRRRVERVSGQRGILGG